MDDELTRLGDPAPASAIGAGVVGTTGGRFEPGTLFAGRFRIVALLGRGGMGEVYRADDLKLGQPVALKLLPEPLAADPARLAQFHNEVRVAREVSHRNVCRTYDIGEADGRHFISMEYVDGEDLASLLRRVGRFPQDRAVEVARQICAGLAAAHDRGVLHRDLKPANIMIDGQGHVRITDFGLASIAGHIDNIRSGTPAYMAPEQLAGREVSARSDIYALGLVLFELFTGRRVFEATTLTDLLQLHDSGAVKTPSSVVRDLDPTIERAILRCLERDPSNRPSSALAVSAALPGGSPLAAALAAGETPSPEMVAAAGEQSALRAGVGLATLAVAVLSLMLLALVADRVLLLHRIPIARSADGLRDRARDLLQRVGYGETAADSADGWWVWPTFLNYIARTDQRQDRWTVLSTGRAPTLLFWYRTSPQELVPYSGGGDIFLGDPPPLVPGMRTVILDPEGRLVQFRAVPPALHDQAAEQAVDWSPLFDAAALPFASFRPTTPRLNPSIFSDTRAAFEGTMPGLDRAVRVEVAAYAGRPVSFSVIGAWNEPAADAAAPRSRGTLFAAGSAIVAAVLLVGAVLLARRNLRSGRGDRRGAMRLAVVVFASLAAAALIDARHSSTITVEYARINRLLAIALFRAAGLWLTYIALEPYVRRFWPELLIGWTRLWGGRFRDPLVGREILVGATAGVIVTIFIFSHALAQALLGPPPPPEISLTATISGVRATVAVLFANVTRTIVNVMQVTFIVVVIKALVRRTWLVLLLTCVIIFPIAISGTFSGEQLALDIPYTVIGILMVVGVLLRFGLLALCVTFFVFMLLAGMPVTADFGTPYAAMSTWLLLATAALAAFGFYASRGNEPLFGRALLD